MKTTSVLPFCRKFVRSYRPALFAIVGLAFFAVLTSTARAQIHITTLNTSHTQNFDGMGTGDLTITDEITGSLFGFFALREFGNANPNFIQSDDGSDTTANFKNYGASLQFDRALGMLPGPATGGMRLGIRFANSSGSPINSFSVTFTGEQWRNGGNQTPHTLVFAYRKDANVNDLTTGAYTAVPALAFVSPQTGPVASDLDGNAAPNRVTLSATFAVIVMPGEEIMLRWEDLDAFGNDHGLAIDDLSITPHGSSTAADVSISGRVVDSSGRGISRTRVSVIGGAIETPIYAMTNPFGYYRFHGLESGHGYVLRVEAKRHSFENPVLFVNVLDNMTGIDFVASP